MGCRYRTGVLPGIPGGEVRETLRRHGHPRWSPLLAYPLQWSGASYRGPLPIQHYHISMSIPTTPTITQPAAPPFQRATFPPPPPPSNLLTDGDRRRAGPPKKNTHQRGHAPVHRPPPPSTTANTTTRSATGDGGANARTRADTTSPSPVDTHCASRFGAPPCHLVASPSLADKHCG